MFIDYSVEKLAQLAARIRTCLDQLSYDQVWARAGDNQNAVGNLVLHLCGNVRQWIGYGVGGQPDVRVRDEEFAARGKVQPAELAERLETTVRDAIAIIRLVPAERLREMVTIQKYHLTVLQAIYHVIEHFAQHTGQVIFATKLMTASDLGFYKHLNKPAAHGEKTP
jgi:uncharacterized damage-inducible protein DinB